MTKLLKSFQQFLKISQPELKKYHFISFLTKKQHSFSNFSFGHVYLAVLPIFFSQNRNIFCQISKLNWNILCFISKKIPKMILWTSKLHFCEPCGKISLQVVKKFARKQKSKAALNCFQKHIFFSQYCLFEHGEKILLKTVLNYFLDNVQNLSQKSWKTCSKNEIFFVFSGKNKFPQNVPLYANRADLTTESKFLSLKIENYFRCYNICTKCESFVEKTLRRNCILSKKTFTNLTVKKLQEGQKICQR